MYLTKNVNRSDVKAVVQWDRNRTAAAYPYPAEALVVIQRFILEGQLPAQGNPVLPTL